MIKWTNLGLTYEQALHGVQSAIQHAISSGFGKDTEPKHLRVGIDARASDHAALAVLLIQKGLITEQEYLEAVRLAMNHELATRQEEFGVSFR